MRVPNKNYLALLGLPGPGKNNEKAVFLGKASTTKEAQALEKKHPEGPFTGLCWVHPDYPDTNWARVVYGLTAAAGLTIDSPCDDTVGVDGFFPVCVRHACNQPCHTPSLPFVGDHSLFPNGLIRQPWPDPLLARVAATMITRVSCFVSCLLGLLCIAHEASN